MRAHNIVSQCIGIYDFSYGPYALGDVITWQENLLIEAAENKVEKTDIYIIIDPGSGFFVNQPHLTPNNYQEFFLNLFPAFLCSPIPFTIHIITNKTLFNIKLIQHVLLHQSVTWPSIRDHLKHKDIWSSHGRINRFFENYHYLPRLAPPRGYEDSMDRFLKKYCRGRFVVTVNIRQRKLYPHAAYEQPGSFRRDSNLQGWYSFFKRIHTEFPDVLFVIIGGFYEWEKELFHHPNVIIVRSSGYDLPHELSLMHQSDLFMGTSSGFSAMATFSTIPYIITNFDHNATFHTGIPINSHTYPFALKNQILSWELESEELLLHLFLRHYHVLKGRSSEKRKDM